MKISSFYKKAVWTVQCSCAALICSIALCFGSAAPALAAQATVSTPHLAIFGWGDQAAGKAEQLVGKAQAKIDNKLAGNAKQIRGRAKSDIGRVENAAQRNADQAGAMAKDLKKDTDKNFSKARDSVKDTANNLVDRAKKAINN